MMEKRTFDVCNCIVMGGVVLPSPVCYSSPRLRPPLPLPSSLPLGWGRVGRLPASLQPADTSLASLSPPCP